MSSTAEPVETHHDRQFVVMAASRNNAGMASKFRRRLLHYDTFDAVVKLVQSSYKVVVLTGAGISTSVGVKDFRSQNGLFNLLEKNGYDDPQSLFDIDQFKDNPDRFYNVVRHIIPPPETPFSPTHAFIKLLQDKNKLLTNYTQNIDTLEQKASISPENLVYVHGNLAEATCTTCGRVRRAEKYLPPLLSPTREGALKCGKCWDKNAVTPKRAPKKFSTNKRLLKKRRRNEFEDDEDDTVKGDEYPYGILKPNIVFYGESPADDFNPRWKSDRAIADLFIIIGTSLSVQPVANMPFGLSPHVPQVYISKQRCQLLGFDPDVQLLGACDEVVEELTRRAGWELSHQMIKADGPPIRVELIEGTSNQYLVKRDSKKASSA